LDHSQVSEEWRLIERLLDDGRHVIMKMGLEEECSEFAMAAKGYAEERTRITEFDLEKGVDNELSASAPGGKPHGQQGIQAFGNVRRTLFWLSDAVRPTIHYPKDSRETTVY
jgi:hypothetical protein